MAYIDTYKGIDYGPRKGTLGLLYHMTEGAGGVGDVTYLARRPGESLVAWRTRVRGVSVNAVCIDDGTVYQMLPWASASGSLNPADRAAEYGYYGGSVLREVLGDHWTDPNTRLVSMEIAGKRANGPTYAQVKAAIAWGLDMKARFPTLRGALGHHDQSPKECPGLTPAMLAIFEGIGGHGLWTQDQEGDVRFVNSQGYDVASSKRLKVAKGTPWKTLDGAAAGAFSADAEVVCLGKADASTGKWVVQIGTGNLYDDRVVRASLVLVESSATPTEYVAPADPVKTAVNSALDHVAPAVEAAAAAIAEARPR